MSREVLAYVDRVVAASMRPASKAVQPVVKAAQQAVEGARSYDAADAALRRLEGRATAEGLTEVLGGAMMNGTSGGSVDG